MGNSKGSNEGPVQKTDWSTLSLNNRVENAHQPTRRKEKCLIKFKSPQGVQRTVSLMGKIRNLFSLEVGRYSNKASQQKAAFKEACSIWFEAAQMILCA